MNETRLEKAFLEGEQVILRPLKSEDAEGGYPMWLNDPEVSAHNSHHVFPYTKANALAYISQASQSKTDMVLAIEAKDSKKHIGNIALQKIDWVSRNAEYAIMLGDREYWGKGVAAEASRLILDHGFKAMQLHRIYCGTSSENVPMQKLAAKLGFSEEGRRKDAHWKDGKYCDIIEYGLLAK